MSQNEYPHLDTWVQQSPLPFKRLKMSQRLGYSWSIAFLLARGDTQHQKTIAEEVVAVLRHDLEKDFPTAAVWKTSPLPPTVLKQLHIEANPSGLIGLYMGDQALMSWLDALLISTESVVPKQPQQSMLQQTDSHAIFLAQHSHARCCSLLRLLDREGYIVLSQAAAQPNLWQLEQPAPICWDAVGNLGIFSNLIGRNLLHSLFATVDEQLHTVLLGEGVGLLHQLVQLTRAFQAFHRTYPILQFVNHTHHLQTQAGLLMVAQRVFHQGLTTLGAAAPATL